LTTFITSIVQHHATTRPTAPAYSFMSNGEQIDSQLCYADVDTQARAIAANLQISHGLKKGDRVVLLFVPGLDFIRAFHACLYAGFIAIPVNPPSSTGQSWANFVAIVDNAGAAVILADATKQQFLVRQNVVHQTSLKPAVVDIATLDMTLAGKFQPVEFEADDIAMLQYTSGSTGIPKGVMVTQANILHNMKLINEQVSRHYTVGVSWLPVYHDMGLFGGVLQSAYVGGHHISMPPTAFLLKPARWLKAIAEHGAAVSCAPNFAFDLCVDAIDDATAATLDLSHWKVVASGAEPVLPPTLRRFGRKFFKCGFNPVGFVPCYGLAESTLLVCARKPDYNKPPTSIAVDKSALKQRNIELRDRESADVKEFVSCGKPDTNQIAIVDTENLTALPENRVGEIWIRSESTSPGYWNDPQRTADVFNASLNGFNDYYRTGDLGFLHDGEIYIAGRLKDLIIVHGKNHYPGDIERTAQAVHDALMLDSGAVFSIDVEGVERIVIAQEIKQARARDFTSDATLADTIIEAMKEAINRHHEVQVHGVMLTKPGRIFKTSSGKIRRSACRDAYVAQQFEHVGNWQSLELQRFLAGETVTRNEAHVDKFDVITPATIEQQILKWIAQRIGVGIDEIDANANATSLGLDSVDVMSLFGDITGAMQLPIEPDAVQLWEIDSVKELAQRLYDAHTRQGASGAQPDSGEIEGML
jgi:acyl-CoA synthetase (AMP-forming)/AMP-acid ligase II/acyl carrier protein